MEIRLISIGRIREKHLREGIDEYLKRLRPYTRITLLEGLDEKTSPRARENELGEARRKEGTKVLSLIGQNELLVAFDMRGRMVTSQEMAALIDGFRHTGKPRLNLVIGSASGLSEAVKDRADYVLSLSSLTFPHQMSVLIVAEQLYRSFAILHSHPYHK